MRGVLKSWIRIRDLTRTRAVMGSNSYLGILAHEDSDYDSDYDSGARTDGLGLELAHDNDCLSLHTITFPYLLTPDLQYSSPGIGLGSDLSANFRDSDLRSYRLEHVLGNSGAQRLGL